MKEFNFISGKTHGGKGHADDMFADAFGELIAEQQGREFPVERIFNITEEDAKNPDILIFDIGGGEYDHHQRDFDQKRENGVPYSSFGLLWRDYAHCIDGVTEEVANIVDVELVQGIDAHDNGALKPQDDIARVMTLSMVMNLFNPNWDDNTNPDIAFKNGVALAKVILKKVIERAISKCKAKSIVLKAIEDSKDGIMELEQFCPWQDYLFECGDKSKDILYVIFPSNRGGYNVQAVPEAPNSFATKKAFPESWRGLSNSDLQKACGEPDATFCHKAGFLLTAKSKEACLRLAKKAVKA